MYLAHHGRLPLQLLAVTFTKCCVTQAIPMLGDVFEVQQHERHRTAPKHQMDRCAVGLGSNARRRRLRIQTRLKLGIRRRIDCRRSMQCDRAAVQTLPTLQGADAQCRGDLLWLRPSRSFCRRISLRTCMGTLSAAMHSPLVWGNQGAALAKSRSSLTTSYPS